MTGAEVPYSGSVDQLFGWFHDVGGKTVASQGLVLVPYPEAGRVAYRAAGVTPHRMPSVKEGVVVLALWPRFINVGGPGVRGGGPCSLRVRVVIELSNKGVLGGIPVVASTLD